MTNNLGKEREVRQDDCFLLKLFNLVLDHVFTNLDPHKLGNNLDRYYTSYLKCADGIMLTANDEAELQEMLTHLSVELKKKQDFF